MPGELAQWLRAYTVLEKISIHFLASTLGGSQQPVIPVLGNSVFSSGFSGDLSHMHIPTPRSIHIYMYI